MHEFKSPKYYKELRMQYRSRVISKHQADGRGQRSPGAGQTSSSKLQAPKPEPSSGSLKNL